MNPIGTTPLQVRSHGGVPGELRELATAKALSALRLASEPVRAAIDPFIFFVGSEAGHASVLYYRYDGHYGLVARGGAGNGRASRAGT
ncbi:MAG TPA: hypothetical protein VME44_12590 [Streptosporangiaceae bacterium]|nr:hypothetical protein [Streptosporangiaceae bacterium]